MLDLGGLIKRSTFSNQYQASRTQHPAYSVTFVPSTSKNFLIHSGWAGQAAAVTKLPSTYALVKVLLTSPHLAPARKTSGLTAGYAEMVLPSMTFAAASNCAPWQIAAIGLMALAKCCTAATPFSFSRRYSG